MTRQSKHKHRVLRHMLGTIYEVRRIQKLSSVLRQAYRTMSAAMAQAYAKARAEQESKT
jgi:hypothetical protein